ncbi:type II toxin-antitoxin system VapC family toxin [Mucilaginibacter gracilis]|uniref:type II toxin-antitoxin system VapC family toxin n=1 Tax=Mucilaginibacter gracilis TaxID=423350 RepID=UPI0013C330E9|nr:type II toxin-antitoxin system VapC family toxin [Mucilaginibacter gracilis]
MIFDTNILIYLSKYLLDPDRILSKQAKDSVSIITKIETLGFNFQKADEHKLLSDLCNELIVIPLSDQIAEETIKLRKGNRIKLPDAIIYATALTQGLPLLTNNIADFKNLGNKVELVNPFSI